MAHWSLDLVELEAATVGRIKETNVENKELMPLKGIQFWGCKGGLL